MTAPFVLLPYQSRWLADKSPVKVWAKSRRIGASWAEACDAVLTASAEDGTNVLYSSYNRPMAQTWITDAAGWAKHFGMAAEIREDLWPGRDDGRQSIRNFYIKFRSGWRIQALSSKPNNLRGVQGVVVLDESAFIDSLDEMLKAAIAILMWGGKVRIISTFNGENAFFDLVNGVRTGKLPYSLHHTTIDDALREGLYQRICLVSGIVWTPEREAAWRESLMEQYGDAADEELLCIPRTGSGNYIARASIERCFEERPVFRLSLTDDFLTMREVDRQVYIDNWMYDNVSQRLDALPRHLKSYAGMDFARSGDLSALVVLTEREDLTYDTPLIIEMRNVSFEAQRQILFAVLARLPHFAKIAMDSSGNGAWLGEITGLEFGERVEAVKFSEPKLLQIMPALKDAIENRRLVVPRHADILKDLRSIELIRGVPKVDPNKRYQGTDGKARHGDTAVAMALAVYAASGAGEAAASGLQNPVANINHARRRRSLWPAR